MSRIERVQKALKQTWEDNEITAVNSLFMPGARILGLEEAEVLRAEEFGAFFRMIQRQFSDIRFDFIHGIEQGDWIALSFFLSGRDLATGRDVRTVGHLMLEFQNDKIITAMNFIDFMSLLEQTGRLPPRARDRAILGERLQFSPDPRRIAN